MACYSYAVGIKKAKRGKIYIQANNEESSNPTECMDGSMVRTNRKIKYKCDSAYTFKMCKYAVYVHGSDQILSSVRHVIR